jgi:hypothetical protein
MFFFAGVDILVQILYHPNISLIPKRRLKLKQVK